LISGIGIGHWMSAVIWTTGEERATALQYAIPYV